MPLEVASWGVFALGVLLIAGNWTCLMSSCRGNHMSMVPPLGAVLVFLACTHLPIGWKLGALAFVIDPPLPAVLVGSVLMLVRRR